MKTSDSIKELATAFAKAQAALKNAPFDKMNPHFKSKYATLVSVRDVLVPTLSANGLSVIQGASVMDGQSVVTTRLMHTSGEWIESAYPFQVDKPQQMASAMTYARRISLAAICGIASEEDDDGNAANTSPPKTAAVTTIPKAEARPEYSRMRENIRTINDTGTIEDLRLFYKNNVKTIESFDQGWQAQIMKEFDDAVASLKAKAA